MQSYNPSDLEAYNVRMATTSCRLTIDKYFKETNDLFFNPKEEASSKDSRSWLLRASYENIDSSTTQPNEAKSSVDSQSMWFSRTTYSENLNDQIEFMDYFLSLVETPFDFCVSHEEFYKYGVVNIDTTNNIAKLLIETHGFIKNIDFKIIVEKVKAVNMIERHI